MTGRQNSNLAHQGQPGGCVFRMFRAEDECQRDFCVRLSECPRFQGRLDGDPRSALLVPLPVAAGYRGSREDSGNSLEYALNGNDVVVDV